MSIYRSVYMTFWTDTDIVDNYTPEDRYFMLYCLTNNYTNLCGCYEISIKQMERDLGYNEDTIKNLLKRFNTLHKSIIYNQDTKEMLIKNWSKYNWTKSEKLDKPLLNEIKNIKTPEFKDFLAKKYNERDTVSIPYTYPMDTTVSVSVSDTVSVTDNKNNRVIGEEEKDTLSAQKKVKKFEPPTLEEINAYIQEKGYKVDGKAFYDYFTEGNWKDSKGNQVKNWKQKIITWNKFGNKQDGFNQEEEYRKFLEDTSND